MNDHVLGCWAKLCECEETHYHSYKCSYGCICPSLRAYGEKMAEEMRAACIAAVEALEPFNKQAMLHKVEDVLTALREVQP